MRAIMKPGARYLTGSGLETTLVFLDGTELPSFAAFPLLDREDGQRRLETYYRQHADVAAASNMGFIFEAPTWRANPDWGATIGYDQDGIARVNRSGVALMRRLAADYSMSTLVSFEIGPRGDGYRVDQMMSPDEAADYHSLQIGAASEADLASAYTLTYADEAVGIVEAARATNLPIAISFTVETNGRLPSGQRLGEAIEEVDERTGSYTSHFGVNCAHPHHLATSFDGPFVERIRALKANASQKSHSELDAATSLDSGDPEELGHDYSLLIGKLPNLNVFGGCCGTDIRHIRAIVAALGHPPIKRMGRVC